MVDSSYFFQPAASRMEFCTSLQSYRGLDKAYIVTLSSVSHTTLRDTMAKSDVQRQRESRQRQRAQLEERIDHHLSDVKISIELRAGRQVVTFDMSADTERALSEIAKTKGKTLDGIFRGVIAKHIREWARLRMRKEARERKVAQGQAEREVQRLKAKMAEMERLLAEYRAGKQTDEDHGSK